jgi:hypothetical protein
MMPIRAAAARTLPAALALGLAVWMPASAQQAQPPQREVTVENETDLVIYEFYLSASGAAERGNDRLGASTLPAGATHSIRLGRGRDCTFDATAVFQDGSTEARRGVDICRNPRLVFGDPSLPRLEASVANRTDTMLRELYAVRSGAAGDREWGPDRLGAEVIAPGASFTLRLRSRDCSFDLRAVYDDDREEVKEGLDLCRVRDVAFERASIARERRAIVLANRHLATVQEVYLSASTESDWGPDRLGRRMLEIGDDATVEMQGGCEADLRVTFPSGAAEERRAVNVCETARIVIRPGWTVAERLDEEGEVLAPEPSASPGALRLRNAGPLPVVEVYTGPPGGPRGEDRLGADTLPVGGVLEIDPAEAGACAADLVAVFRDGREATRSGVDLCAGEEVEIR